MEVGLSIAQMQRGMDVEGFYLLKAAFAKVTASGKPFLSAVLADTSGTIEAKVWDYSGPIGERDVGKVLKVRGSVSDYRGMPQLTVDKLRLAEDNDRVDVSKLVSVAPIDREAGYDEVKALVATIEDLDYRAVCEQMLHHHEAAFRTIPAAKSVHHAWVGGLLEHTLSVATLCLRFCDHYPDLDRQTLLAGAICHDLGKIWEFSGGLANDYTDAGRLVGHINLCLGKLDRHLAKSGLDEELILHFQHLILSHHGLYEYGSPRLPQTAEAFALHYADNIDAKITQSRSLFGELEDGESGWSPYQKSLERQLFQAPKTPEAESRKPRTSKRTAAEPEAPRLNQCSLL